MRVESFFKVVLCFHLLLLGVVSTAQKDLDSSITASKNKIFEDPDRAISIGNEIYLKATQPETKVNALMLISNAYLSKRDNLKSLEYALKTREFLNEISSLRTRINVLNTIGMQHQQLRIYDKSIEYLDEALQLSKQITNPDSLFSVLGYNYTIRGFIYREQMSCEIALSYFDKAFNEFEKKPEDKTMIANLSTITYNKGNCFLQLSQVDSARVNFNKSIIYADEVGAKSLYAFAKKGLSEVYTIEGKYTEAIKELKEAEEASSNVGDLILNQGIYKNLSDNYLAINDHKFYNLYFKKYSEVQKRITKKEQTTINSSINNLIEDSYSSTEKTLSNLKIVRWVLIILLLISIIIFGSFSIKNHKKYKEAKEKLETLKA
ncbi:tetratricopeptide repeat protein [Aequorivita xiaoshiensis]|uniref:Tetratricopeptide repeat protein n=1 Tax=Aequorivita xiaoshiensis TaxID=2874476 RepID=A0A9X1R2W6_9FLAO|nr:hypothetical protein [Aequorivita xiaoshiensis]MCG2430807.1 hypothetical protein [Aequorivita xiaoshiensis]